MPTRSELRQDCLASGKFFQSAVLVIVCHPAPRFQRSLPFRVLFDSLFYPLLGDNPHLSIFTICEHLEKGPGLAETPVVLIPKEKAPSFARGPEGSGRRGRPLITSRNRCCCGCPMWPSDTLGEGSPARPWRSSGQKEKGPAVVQGPFGNYDLVGPV